MGFVSIRKILDAMGKAVSSNKVALTALVGDGFTAVIKGSTAIVSTIAEIVKALQDCWCCFR